MFVYKKIAKLKINLHLIIYTPILAMVTNIHNEQKIANDFGILFELEMKKKKKEIYSR
jgi:hypothetical protein